MHVGLINSPQTKKTLLYSIISAIACGLIQSEWIFWIPGAVFGILFAIANFHRKFQIGLYTILSSVIYIGAVRIFFKVSGNHLNNYLVGGFFAGAFGALTLALLTKLISKTAITSLDEFRATIIGAITGIAFVYIFSSAMGEPFSNDANMNWVLIPIAFAIWQVPIGWLLTKSIQSNSNLSNGQFTNAPG
jgi:hypothetical protein